MANYVSHNQMVTTNQDPWDDPSHRPSTNRHPGPPPQSAPAGRARCRGGRSPRQGVVASAPAIPGPGRSWVVLCTSIMYTSLMWICLIWAQYTNTDDDDDDEEEEDDDDDDEEEEEDDCGIPLLYTKSRWLRLGD